MKRRKALKYRILGCIVCLLAINTLNAQNVPINKNENRQYRIYVEFLGAGVNTLYTVNLEYQILTNTITNLGLRAGFGFMKDRGWNSISMPIMLNKRWGNEFSSHFLSTNIGTTYYYGGPIIIDSLNPSLNFDYNNNRLIYNLQVGYVYKPLGRGLIIELGLTSYMGNIVSHSAEEVSNTFIEENSFRIMFWPHLSVGYSF